jgi:hypothetical protein
LAAGLTEGAIAKYETLRCPIPPDKLARIERALAEERKDCESRREERGQPMGIEDMPATFRSR